MRQSIIIGAMIASVLASPAESATESEIKEPYQWVRTLEAAQEQIGRGNQSAHHYLPKLIAEIADEIDKADVDVILEPRNSRAIIAYALNGGDGRVVRKLLGLGKLSKTDERIAKGALAYSEGKYSKATEQLAEINLRGLDVSLAARVALIQSILVYKTDQKRAIALLDEARLLGTGTLVEEAALRREVILVAAAKDHDGFERLSGQYFRKFRNSVFADHFKQNFSTAASGLEYDAGKERLSKLEEIIGLLNEAEQSALYVMLAERAIFRGNLSLTEFAAANAKALSQPQSLAYVRSELYGASASVVGLETEKAMSSLRGIPAAALAPTDAELLEAALTIGEEVMRPPSPSDGNADGRASSDSENGKRAISERQMPDGEPKQDAKEAPVRDQVLEAATKAIAEADQLLREKR